MNKGEVRRKQIQFYSYAFGACVLLMFGRMIENNGIAYLAVGIETIGVLAIFLGESIADIFGKMIRFRRKRNQFQDVLFLKKRVLTIQIIMGIILFAAVFFLADGIAGKIFSMERAALIIRILAPVLLLRMIGTYYTGNLQSFGLHMPVALVSLLRQILFLILGGVLCNNRLAYGKKVAALLKSDDFYGMYGAVGLAIAITLTELICVIALMIFYFLSDRKYDNKRVLEGLQKSESVKDTILNFANLNKEGVLLSFCKRALILVPFIMLTSLEYKGIFYGKFIVIYSVPVFIIAARFCLVYARITSAVKNKNTRAMREYIQTGMQYAFATGALIAVLGAVLAPRIVLGFFPTDTFLTTFLQYGSLLVLAVIILSYFCMVQVALRHTMISVMALLSTTIIFAIMSIIMDSNMDGAPEAIIYAGILSFLIVALILAAWTIHQYRVSVDYISVLIVPLICIGITGLVILLFVRLLAPHIGNGFCLILGCLLGIVLYIAGLGLCRCFGEVEIERLYGKTGKSLLSLLFR